MSDLDAKLSRCFEAVFPKTDPTSIPSLSRANCGAWDSLAAVTLVRVIEEEFGVTIDLLEVEDLDSYAGIREYLASVAQA